MRTFLCFALLAASSSIVGADEIPGSSISYGNWNGAGWTGEDGTFSHCSVGADYMHGNTLMLSVNADATVSVGVLTPSDTFIANEDFPVALFVDRRAPFYANATALDARFAMLVIDDFDRALDSFRRGQVLVVQSKFGEVPFDLTGTSRALAAVYQCAVTNQGYTAGPAAPAYTGGVDPAVLMQVATGNITALGVSDFAFLTAAEISEVFPDANPNLQSVFWRSPSLGLLSGVMVAERVPDEDLKATDGADLASLAGMCTGDFVTGVRQLPAEVEMREIRAGCSTGTSTSEHYLTKFFMDDKVVYSWLWFEGDQADNGAGPERRQMSENAALQTASFLSEP
jgi:hypothetical protein